MQNIVSQRGQQLKFDVLVLGSGIVGLSYTLELLKYQPMTNIALFSKTQLHESNSHYAQGGIAAAVSSDVSQHIEDTLLAGDGLCHLETVQHVIQQGQKSIEFLIEQGVQFDCDHHNQFLRGIEAGHRTSRIYRAGDQTGGVVTDALIKKIREYSQVTIFENYIAVNLITQIHAHQPGAFPEVIGAYILDESTGLIHTFLAHLTVLATGGAGKVYRYTTNPNSATGDGVAMAYRANARTGGMEFYQFHPTLLYHKKIHHFLISEALRGEGAYLRLPETEERFMHRYAPETMELSTRDIVSRVVFSEIEQSQYDYVYLDIRHRPKSFLKKRFPVIYRTLLKLGLDLSQDLIPVVPAAHYMGGGILADVYGRTDLPRLLAIGETAFTGLHGANRLASNSLLEGIVMGRNAASISGEYIHQPVRNLRTIQDWDSTSVLDLRRASQINGHWRGLRGEMSSYAGIVRTEAGLRDQLKLVLARREMIEQYYWKYTITRDVIELRNIILISEQIVRAALKRRLSRGGHYRDDADQRHLYDNSLRKDPHHDA